MDMKTVEVALRSRWEEWFRSIDDVDAGFVDRVMTDSFRMFDYSGGTKTAQDYRGMWNLIDPGFEGVHEMKQFEVCPVNKTVAVAFGSYAGKARFLDGTEVGGTIRFSTVWTLEQDEWRCAFYHGAMVGDSEPG